MDSSGPDYENLLNHNMHSYTGKALRRANRHLELPFSLRLRKSDIALLCEHLLKIVPKRRAVFSGTWEKQEVLAKLFYRPLHIRRHLQRETAGCQALAKAGIPTPKVLYAGKTDNASVGVLLFEYLHPISSLRDVWNALEFREEKQLLFRQLLDIIAKMHQAGLKQCDLHLDNFFIHHHTLYAIDGASVTRSSNGRPLAKQESLHNLGLLFAQLTTQDCAITIDLFREYLKARAWDDTERIHDDLQSQIQQQQEWRFKKYFARNLFRKTDRVVYQRSFRHFMLCIKSDYSPAMADYLDSLQQLSPLPNSQSKNSFSEEFSVQIAGTDFVVTRYRHKGIDKTALSCWRMSPAAHAWQKAHRDASLDQTAPKPVALLEKHFGPFCSTSFYICKADG